MNSLFRKKRALTSFNMLVMMLRIVFLVIALLAIIVIISFGLEVNLETKSTEAYTLMGRLLYSPEGLSLNDPITGRVVSGVIDVNNLNNSRLDSGVYIKSNNRLCARAEIYIYTNSTPEFVGVAKFKEDLFNAYNPMADSWAKIPGVGGVDKFDQTYPIIVQRADGSRALGKVDFRVLIPRGTI